MPDLDRLLATYLNEHLFGSTAGLDLFRRVARSHRGTELGDKLQRLADEVQTDRDALLSIMADLEITPSRLRVAVGHTVERLGRLKPNGTLIRRSPLTDLLEIEALRVAVLAKTAGWEVLREVAAREARLSRDTICDLLDRANDQRERLGELHLEVGRRTLG
ncbi:MAG: hypothetical protein M3353_03180 [Actinomycetota bacterium]|nr:hypothetical protein [Actinomycetota bacterium]